MYWPAFSLSSFDTAVPCEIVSAAGAEANAGAVDENNTTMTVIIATAHIRHLLAETLIVSP